MPWKIDNAKQSVKKRLFHKKDTKPIERKSADERLLNFVL